MQFTDADNVMLHVYNNILQTYTQQRRLYIPWAYTHAVADPGLSEGGFVLGKDIETPKSSMEIGCGVSPPLPIEVRSVEELFPSRKFLEKKFLGILHFVVFSCAFKQLLNL